MASATASVELMVELKQSSEEFLQETLMKSQAAEVSQRNVEVTENRRVRWRAYKKLRTLYRRYLRQQASILQEANGIHMGME